MTLQNSFEIAADSLTVQSLRMQVHANNIANVDTPNYVRKVPVLVSDDTVPFSALLEDMHGHGMASSISLQKGGVLMTGVIKDPTPGKRVYNPNHPNADANGYVTLSNVNVLSDMADAQRTSRLYEANLAVVGIVKAMTNRALEIGRNQ